MRKFSRYAGVALFSNCVNTRVQGHLCSSSSSTGPSTASGSATHQEQPFSLIDVMGDETLADCQDRPVLSFSKQPLTTFPRHNRNSSSSDNSSSSGSKAESEHIRQPQLESKKDGNGLLPSSSSFSSAASQSFSKVGTPEDIRRAVREAVLVPLGAQSTSGSASSNSSNSSGGGVDDQKRGKNKKSREALASVSIQPLTVRLADKFGMPAELPRGSPRSATDLLSLSPATLREQLQNWLERNRVGALTAVQLSVIPFILEYRDVLCIAPTATGKTFSYVFPTMLRLAMDEAAGRNGTSAAASPSSVASVAVEGEGDSGEDSSAASAGFRRRDVEALLREKIASGEVCRYCELSVADTPLCPMTGVPHPPPPSSQDHMPLNHRCRHAVRLEELSGIAEPRVLILVPTSQLAFQVYNVCRSLHSDFEVRYMVRASSAEEQQRFLRALEGTDVLVSTPETILPALYKQKLSLKRVRTLILDEVDDIVSTNHFEKLKIILGALPKGHDRPQRLLFGASLPPVAYNMIREKMLMPSHRFVLADVQTDHLGHPVTTGHASTAAAAAAGQTPSPANSGEVLSTTTASTTAPAAAAVRGLLTGNSGLTHVVFMLGRIEKLQKLAWLFQTGRLTFDQRILIFCNSRHNVAYVCEHLRTLVPEVNVTTLTSRASTTAREGVLKMFATGVSTVLVCTDLLSRGIDFKGVVYVVHYDMPLEMETWMHRNGRCGRNGQPGYVYTFFQPENVKIAKPLTAYLRQNKQLVPPKLQEYAKQPFVDVFRQSLLHHPTRPYRRNDPQNTTPVLGRGTPRFPDYRQDGIQKNFRPL